MILAICSVENRDLLLEATWHFSRILNQVQAFMTQVDHDANDIFQEVSFPENIQKNIFQEYKYSRNLFSILSLHQN